MEFIVGIFIGSLLSCVFYHYSLEVGVISEYFYSN